MRDRASRYAIYTGLKILCMCVWEVKRYEANPSWFNACVPVQYLYLTEAELGFSLAAF